MKNTNKKRCLSLIKEIEDGDYYGRQFIKKNKLTICDFHIVESVVSEIWNYGKSECFEENVAKLFKKYGFNVISDKNNVMFSIS